MKKAKFIIAFPRPYHDDCWGSESSEKVADVRCEYDSPYVMDWRKHIVVATITVTARGPQGINKYLKVLGSHKTMKKVEGLLREEKKAVLKIWFKESLSSVTECIAKSGVIPHFPLVVTNALENFIVATPKEQEIRELKSRLSEIGHIGKIDRIEVPAEVYLKFRDLNLFSYRTIQAYQEIPEVTMWASEEQKILDMLSAKLRKNILTV